MYIIQENHLFINIFLNSNSYIIISELEAFMRSYILSSKCGAGMGWGIEVGKAMKSIESMEAGA